MRTIALSPAVVTELRLHQLRRAECHLRLGKALTADDFVVAQADGTPYDPDSITKEWRLRVIASGLPRIRFHDTRHTHATHMLSAKVPPQGGLRTHGA
jgi:integrase